MAESSLGGLGSLNSDSNRYLLNMVSQYLSGIGSAMSQNKPIAQAVSDVTTQNMQSQNFMNMMKKILGGMSEGGKVSLTSGGPVGDTKGNMTLSIPTTTDPNIQGNSGNIHPAAVGNMLEFQNMLGGGAGAPSSQGNTALKNMSVLNPSSSPLDTIGRADLVGLTPANISEALQLAQSHEKLGIEKANLKDKPLMNLLEMMHKQAEIAHLNAETERAKKGKDEETSEIKNYEYAAKHGYKGSFEDFKNSGSDATIKDYEYAVKQGYKGDYKQWRLEMAEASRAQNIVNIGEKERETEKFAGQKEFSGGKWLTDLDKHINSKEMADQIDLDATREQAKLHPPTTDKRPKAEVNAELGMLKKKSKARAIVNWIESRIKNNGGTIIGRKGNDKTGEITWTVKWPSGDTKDIVHKVD